LCTYLNRWIVVGTFSAQQLLQHIPFLVISLSFDPWTKQKNDIDRQQFTVKLSSGMKLYVESSLYVDASVKTFVQENKKF
jgi:hypothetical protein